MSGFQTTFFVAFLKLTDYLRVCRGSSTYSWVSSPSSATVSSGHDLPLAPAECPENLFLFSKSLQIAVITSSSPFHLNLGTELSCLRPAALAFACLS
jgi:hypothetical protein